jgi:hypothetical protein
MPDNTAKEITVTLSPATSYLIQRAFEESQKRGEKETRYLKSAEQYIEVMLDFGYKRKQSEWQSRDKQAVGTMLREALDKLVNHKPLSAEESKLVKTFQQASQPQSA